jgi:hypothetical protein
MIKSTKTTLDFANKAKLKNLHQFVDEYRSVVVKFVDLLWNLEKIPSLIPKEITSQVKDAHNADGLGSLIVSESNSGVINVHMHVMRI